MKWSGSSGQETETEKEMEGKRPRSSSVCILVFLFFVPEATDSCLLLSMVGLG